jgi:hypothetical protein
VVVPQRVRRNETFRKADYACAALTGFCDQPAGLFGRALSVEENWGSLHRRYPYYAVFIAHFAPQK